MTSLSRWLFRKLTEQLYGRWSALYDPVSKLVSLGHWGRWRESASDYISGEIVLELGFGTGHLMATMSANCKRTYGIDASPMMASRTASRLRQLRLEANLVQGRAQHLPFLDDHFDTVIATFPTTYILDPSTINECARVVARGRKVGEAGRLVVTGVWTNTTSRLLRVPFFQFYGGPDWKAIQTYVETLKDEGFCPAIVEAVSDGFSVGTIVALSSDVSDR